MIIEIKVPAPGESITEVELGDWLVEDGATVEMEDELVEINSDKATLTVVAENDGVVKILKGAGEVAEVGEVIGQLDTSGAGAKPQESPAAKEPEKTAETAAPQTQTEGYAKGVPSVSAAKMMAEKNISATEISGSGRGGRITKTDVVQQAEKAAAAPSADNGKKAEKKAETAAAKALPGSRNESRKRMTPLRRKIAERLVSAKNDTAMLTTFNEVDMHNIMELRKSYKEKFKEFHGIGLGFMSLFTKACTEAMQHFPSINSQIDGTDQVLFDYVDLGIAVSSPRGLVVPVVRNAESMSFAEIEKEIYRLAVRARDGDLTIDEMTGGTFTITNGGIFGSMLSTPILNPPQSAILGMHNIVQRPVAINGEVVIRPIMYVALSYDHRIVDGKESVSFLYKVKELLEDPVRLMLGF